MRQISSDQTFGAKFIAPVLVVLVFDMAALSLWWDPNEWPMSLVHASVDPIRWVFAAVAVLLTVGSLWFGTRLKAVNVDDDALYVSNFRREIRILFAEIASVAVEGWSTSQVVAVTFKSDTPFGRKIVFMPKLRFLTFGPPPVVEELQQLVACHQPTQHPVAS
ncbi:MAG TPA: hypothetical protein VNW46_13055 [Gemmatimonadaceae bacterium]|jgi:hypothetical protein|nr:hypothetical protein [Gemmatimonadaceae bacterium]